jgi:flavin reductase (DIM6/NTAB) family NADH-FMN oxidoreductase RutF
MFFTPGNHKECGLQHNPFKAIVSPRPIGWISSVGKDGGVNLAPYSFFNAISDTPPMVAFSASPGDDGEKDSLAYIRETEEFVVNIVSRAQTNGMNASSATLPRGQSEFDHAELGKTASKIVTPPRVTDSPCQLECCLWDIITLPEAAQGRRNNLVIGTVVGIHIDDAVIVDGKVDVTRYQPVCRLGYMDYAAIDTVFALKRPD